MSQKCPQGPGSDSTPSSPLSEPLLDPKDAADLLTVRPSWVYEAVRSGKLPHIKVGRHLRFLRSDLERWVLDQRHAR
jgi:excisionase family DNA binding protein